MKYWVYINNKVDGPYDENNLATVEGFTPETLICSEEVASNGGQEWVKASSVFEFDEEPIEPTPVSAPQPTQEQPTVNTQELLARLEALTSGMSSLQAKFEAMQTHLDKTLEENKKLAQQVASQQNKDIPMMSSEDDTRTNTITLTRHDISSSAQSEETPSYPQQATPQEEELIIRSALDSMYGGKLLDTAEVKEPEEDTFHDLVTGETSADLAREEEEQAVEEIATQLHFTPVEEEQPVVENAVITTPSVFEAEKDALINELTSSAKDDVLDKIIAEHQREEDSNHTDATALAAAGAVAGLTAAAFVDASKDANQTAAFAIATDKENPEQLEEVLPADQLPEDVLPPALNEEPAPQEQPSQAQLPSVEQEPDVAPIPEEQPQEKVDLPIADLPQVENIPVQPQEQVVIQPQLAVMDTPQELPQAEPVVPVAAELPAMEESFAPVQKAEEAHPVPEIPQPQEDLQELVPAINDEEVATQEPVAKPQPEPLPEQPSAKKASVQESQAEENENAVTHEVSPEPQVENTSNPATQPNKPGNITDQDLQEAFGSASDITQQSVQAQDASALLSEEVEAAEGNPNELTEIELKAGSTYLISDFVPPTQVGDEKEQILQPMQENAKKQETIFQDMLAASTIGQSATPLNTDGLPADLSATQINLENTIQAKRGASFDIKTVPMVPEPAQSDRLDINDLNDVNAQHDIKTQGASKSTKWVMRSLIVLLALIVLYVLLGILHILPSSINLFAGKEAAQVQNTQDLLGEQANSSVATQNESAELAKPTPQDQALEKVQNFPLPNRYSLKGFIESKHAAISPELITWEVADAVEPDNYSVTVKVPPENPQNFKTVYRFNYNMQTGLLDPTISDAKNLLDQAYGINPSQSVATTAATAPAQTTATKRVATRRATTRKR